MTGYMYILECSDGSFYTGSTKYLDARLEQHKNGNGANYRVSFERVLIIRELVEHIKKRGEANRFETGAKK